MSRETGGTKRRRIALGRVHSLGVLLVLAFMLMWSNVAVCGEIHKAIKDNDSAKVRELIKNNTDLAFTKDENSFTPPQLAAANANEELLSFLLTTTTVESNARDNSPVSIVQTYCKLDLDGARLSSQNPNNDVIAKLATWPIEPGWDTTVVVSAFEIVSTSIGPKQSSVTVRYSVLGNMFGAKVAHSQTQKELVTFVLTKSPGGWLIQRPQIAPHVSVSAAISALRSLLGDQKDAEHIKRLNAGIDLLTKWKNGAGLSKAP